ncbi:g9695 [Coccomyxa elongata]
MMGSPAVITNPADIGARPVHRFAGPLLLPSGGPACLLQRSARRSSSLLLAHRSSKRNTRNYVRFACQVQAPERTEQSREEYIDSEPNEANVSFIGVPQTWASLADAHGDKLAAIDPHQSPATKLTYLELESQIIQFAAGLQSLSLKAGEKVALFSENSSRWLVADQAVMTLGAADAVRGASSPADEMAYIVSHSESCAIVAQDSQTLERLAPALASSSASQNGNGSNGAPHNGVHRPAVRFAVVLWGEPNDKCRSLLDCPVLSYAEVLARGHRTSATFQSAPLSSGQLATIVYTSGTTGNPKGVMLTHGNLRYQLDNLNFFLKPKPGERSLSLLPPWHIYERSCGYYLFSCACTQVYTNIRKFREDLANYPPHHFVCVPMVLDTLYGRVQQQIKKSSPVKRTLARLFFAIGTAYIRARRILDGVALEYARTAPSMFRVMLATFTAAVLYPLYRLGQVLVFGKIRAALGIMSTVISGGGSLARHLDDFYEALALPVLNGWGLTETSPVLACRRNQARENVRGSVGLPIPGTAVRVVDPDTLQPVPEGQQGLLLARGPGVMKGYFNDEASTARAFVAGDGWFDTGDLGWRAPTGVAGSNMAGHIVLTGRAKDTIVLSSGENVEPAPIEDACAVSPFIQHLVLVGQDHRMLGALVVPAEDAFKELQEIKGAMSDEEIRAVIRAEITKATAARPHFERVAAFEILREPLSVEAGTLTRTFKPRRPAIYAKYAREVADVLSKLR